jgi:hypothetical protein
MLSAFPPIFVPSLGFLGLGSRAFIFGLLVGPSVTKHTLRFRRVLLLGPTLVEVPDQSHRGEQEQYSSRDDEHDISHEHARHLAQGLSLHLHLDVRQQRGEFSKSNHLDVSFSFVATASSSIAVSALMFKRCIR